MWEQWSVYFPRLIGGAEAQNQQYVLLTDQRLHVAWRQVC